MCVACGSRECLPCRIPIANRGEDLTGPCMLERGCAGLLTGSDPAREGRGQSALETRPRLFGESKEASLATQRRPRAWSHIAVVRFFCKGVAFFRSRESGEWTRARLSPCAQTKMGSSFHETSTDSAQCRVTRENREC